MIFDHLTGRALTDDKGRLVVDDSPEPETEYKVMDFRLSKPQTLGAKDLQTERNRTIETLLKDGWIIDRTIVCRPYVMLFFSRTKFYVEPKGDQK